MVGLGTKIYYFLFASHAHYYNKCIEKEENCAWPNGVINKGIFIQQ